MMKYKARFFQALVTSVTLMVLLLSGQGVTAGEVWESRLGAWKNLATTSASSMEGGSYFKQDSAEVKVAKALGQKFRRDQFIPAHPASKITFTFLQPITEFRTVMVLREGKGTTKGNVAFKITTEEGEIYKSKSISHGKGNHERVTLKFKPSKMLILETEDNGDASEDWAIWLGPEIR